MEFGNSKAGGGRSLASLLGSVKRQPAVDAASQAGGPSDQAKRQIELIALTKLTASKTNARTHSPKQLRQIAASIKRFGFTVPVLVNAQNQILAGHGRVEAAKLLGLKAVPVLRLDHLSPVEQRAYAIADNRLAELAGWDRNTLAIELQALIEVGFAVEVTGFDVGEIDLILGDEDKDESPAGAEAKLATASSGSAISRAGDVWQLGDHQLICGDGGDAGAYAAIDAAIRRWQSCSGNSATLSGSSQTFNEIQNERRKTGARRQAGGGATRREAA